MSGTDFVLQPTGTRQDSAGYSLVELLAVLAILSVLLMLIRPMVELDARRRKEAELRQALWQIREGIDAYKKMADSGLLREATPTGYPRNLRVLVDGVTTSTGGTAYLLRSLPVDPFAPAKAAGMDDEGWALRSYQSPPEHPEPGDDVFDVHSRSDEIGLNGVPLNRW